MPKSNFSLDTLLVSHFLNNTSGASVVSCCYSKLLSFAESTLDLPPKQADPLGVEGRRVYTTAGCWPPLYSQGYTANCPLMRSQGFRAFRATTCEPMGSGVGLNGFQSDEAARLDQMLTAMFVDD